MYPILISIFFYFQQLDCRQILSGKMINAILFIFYQEVMKQKMNKPFDIHRNIQKTIEIGHFTRYRRYGTDILLSGNRLQFIRLPLQHCMKYIQVCRK